MVSQPCSPQDFIEVNKNKEYTLIATDLLESVLTDSRLNAQTTKLWQVLFNKARYNPHFDIKISYSYLAKALGKSTRTIARYIDSLQNAGYLIVTHNFDKNGGQRPSTISVRVPQLSIEHAKNKKDRHNRNHSYINDSLIDKNKSALKVDKNTMNNPTVITQLNESANVDYVLHGTNQDNNVDVSKVSISEISNSIQEQCGQEMIGNVSDSKDKIDMGRYDNNVIQIENNKKDIIKNNNNIVVSSFQSNEEEDRLKNEIKILEQQLAEKNKYSLTIKDNAERFEQFKECARINNSLHVARFKLERINKDIEENSKQRKKDLDLQTDPKCILKKEGERALSTFTFKRLITALKTNGYSGTALNTLINEIVFEARFGSLTHCSKTKNPLSLDKAINIGIKLVRENRWSTPTLLKTNEYS